MPKLRIGNLIHVIIVVLLFVAEFSGLGLLLPLIIIAILWILIAWRRQTRFWPVLQSLALITIIYLVGLHLLNNGIFSAAGF